MTKTKQEPKWFKNLKDIAEYEPVPPQDENTVIVTILLDLQYDIHEAMRCARFLKWNKRELMAEGGIVLYEREMEERKWLLDAQKYYDRGVLELKKRLKDSTAYRCVNHKPIYDAMIRSSDDTFLYFYSKL